MDNIKAVLFDFDYTLGNRYRYAFLSYSAFIDEFLPDIPILGMSARSF